MINLDRLYEHVHARDNSLRYASELLEPDNQNRRGQSSDPRRMGWVCPACGNGSGRDGDGIKYNVNGAPGHFKCFRCGWSGDIVDMVGLIYGLTDNVGKARRTIEVLRLDDTLEEAPSASVQARPREGVTMDERMEEAMTLLGESMDLGAWEANEEFLKAREMAEDARKGLAPRGIGQDNPLLAYTGAFRDKRVGPYFESCYAFFGTSKSYVARDMNPNAKRKAGKPPGVPDIPFGLLSVILEPEKSLPDMNVPEPVFVCEGPIDALSLAEVGADAVSLNGTGNEALLLRAFEEFGVRRPVVLAMDDDEAGRKAQSRIANALKDAGIDYSVLDPMPEDLKDRGVKDPNDLLRADRDLLEKWVKKSRRFQIGEHESALNRNIREWAHREFLRMVRRGAIPTGFKTLDGAEFLDGGLYPGLYVIGGASSVGKTSFALQMADQIAKGGTDVIFFSLEMPKIEIIGKSISRYTLTNLIKAGQTRVRKEARERAKSLRDIGREIRDNEDITKAENSYFDDTGDHLSIIEGMGDVTASEISRFVEKHIELTGRRPVVFVDYLQLLPRPEDRFGGMTEKQIVDANIFRLKRISRDLDIAIVGISSFNRESYNVSANMRSFKESGGIEYSSDVLIGLEPVYMGASGNEREAERERYDNTLEEEGFGEVRLIVIKHRAGRRGGVDRFNYYPANNCFLEIGAEKKRRPHR